MVSDEKVQLEYALSINNSKPYDNIEKSRLGVIQESCVEGSIAQRIKGTQGITINFHHKYR